MSAVTGTTSTIPGMAMVSQKPQPSLQEESASTSNLMTGAASATAVAPRVSVSPRNNNNNAPLRPALPSSSAGRRTCVPIIYGFGPPPYQEPPSHLPDAVANGLLAFDVDQKKREIFEQARHAIRMSAQYNKTSRKPWTQITVRLPVVNRDDNGGEETTTTSGEEDLAVVWALMRNATRNVVKETENAYGDITTTWNMWGHAFLEWCNIDIPNTKPVDKYVHPINYCTGEVERKRLEKRRTKEGPSPALDQAFADLEAKIKKDHDRLSPDGRYCWAGYDQCIVTYKNNKQQQSSKKKTGELVLTIKIRTYKLGTGDPSMHGGYMAFTRGGDLSDIDPNRRSRCALFE